MISFAEFSQTISSIFCPETCLICRGIVSSYGFCDRCFKAIDFINDARCEFCYNKIEHKIDGECDKCKQYRYISKFRSIIQYNNIAKDIVISYKNKCNFRVQKWICAMMVNKIPDFGKIDMIVPVPMHWTRYMMRGYCQTQLIACEISAATGIAYGDVLHKVRHTKPQAGLSKAARLTNLAGSFASSTLGNARILLVDDVCTTRTTLETCAKALIDAGAADVCAMTLAMT